MISAKILADSISTVTDTRMVSLEITYPRFILAELNTHRMLSKNSSSSRAIPTSTLLEMVRSSPAIPVHFGKNMPGMSAKETVDDIKGAIRLWEDSAKSAAAFSELMLTKFGLHKQVANRVSEAYHLMKTVISGTEWANLLYLRDHEDAQPDFQALACRIREELDASNPEYLQPGEWHVPYVQTHRALDGSRKYFDESGNPISLREAIAISASCCAQVSYRKNDQSLEKAEKIYERLIPKDAPVHASPLEHQATPMYASNWVSEFGSWEPGVTHMSRDNSLWSGNLRNWVQNRKLIDNEAKW